MKKWRRTEMKKKRKLTDIDINQIETMERSRLLVKRDYFKTLGLIYEEEDEMKDFCKNMVDYLENLLEKN
tara:strand:- start:40 stop:249 length:210 start_codon:yes stop_codon:yes gene_type:complete